MDEAQRRMDIRCEVKKGFQEESLFKSTSISNRKQIRSHLEEQWASCEKLEAMKSE
jgi:hypothetical protein